VLANLQQLREKLEKGFYLDNLYEMAHLCKSLALDTISPVPFFVMEQIFLDIARKWEDIPLTVEEAKLVESKLVNPLEELVEGIEANASNEEIISLMNQVVSTYLISFP
jgi:hypothetical protein